MEIFEKNGVWCIAATDGEIMWQHRRSRSSGALNVNLLPELKEWWNSVAPGEWTISTIASEPANLWVGPKQVICVRDPKLYNLFKLAWKGRLVTVRTIDTTMVYAPYVPLQYSKCSNPTKQG